MIVTIISLSYLVFDEADRMLALEMEVQLREVGILTLYIINKRLHLITLPLVFSQIVDKATVCARQTLLFSATMGDAVIRLARSAVLNPLTITVHGHSASPQSISQQVIFMQPRQKKVPHLQLL